MIESNIGHDNYFLPHAHVPTIPLRSANKLTNATVEIAVLSGEKISEPLARYRCLHSNIHMLTPKSYKIVMECINV